MGNVGGGLSGTLQQIINSEKKKQDTVGDGLGAVNGAIGDAFGDIGGFFGRGRRQRQHQPAPKRHGVVLAHGRAQLGSQ